jgi:hypothetical protein
MSRERLADGSKAPSETVHRTFPGWTGPIPVSEPGYRPRGLGGNGLLPPWARKSTVVTPATGSGQPADGIPADRGSPLPHSGRTPDPRFLSAALVERQHGASSGGRSLATRSPMRPNSSGGTATSAIRKIAYRPCATTFAPILTTFSRRLVSDHSATSLGNAEVRRKLARL